jgi:CheY-like chemotaxis protein
MKVLFIDDDSITIEWISFFLRSKSIEIKTASSIRAGVECLQLWLPDLIVSDFRVREENAFQLLSHLAEREETARIPVIAITGYPLTDSDRRRFSGCLTKPVDPDQLLGTIYECMRVGQEREN